MNQPPLWPKLLRMTLFVGTLFLQTMDLSLIVLFLLNYIGFTRRNVAYYPTSKGLVEKMNRKMMDVMSQENDPYIYTWDEALADVECAITSALNVSVGDTPHHILCGETRLPYDLLCVKLRPVYSVEGHLWFLLVQSQDVFSGAKKVFFGKHTRIC